MANARNILKSDWTRSPLCWLGSLYIRFVHATGSWRILGDDLPKRHWAEDSPFILAFWHGRLLMMPYCWPKGRTIHMLASAHRDGAVISKIAAHFGVATTEGSSSKGGAAALRAMLKRLKKGDCVGMTPDGPRGPRMRASHGVAALARLSGRPVIPVAYATAKGPRLSSWDRFLLPKPFSKGVFIWGGAITVKNDVSREGLDAARLEIEAELNRISREADVMMGREPVEPEPLTEAET